MGRNSWKNNFFKGCCSSSELQHVHTRTAQHCFERVHLSKRIWVNKIQYTYQSGGANMNTLQWPTLFFNYLHFKIPKDVRRGMVGGWLEGRVVVYKNYMQFDYLLQRGYVSRGGIATPLFTESHPFTPISLTFPLFLFFFQYAVIFLNQCFLYINTFKF